jgi:uncharacterized membrane protein YqgA involved in biofilm formation
MKPRRLPIPGTLLNTAAVLVGALLGIALQSFLKQEWRDSAIMAIGLVTIGMGLKMFLTSKNVLFVAGSMTLGGILGTIIGINHGLDFFAGFLREHIEMTGSFKEAILVPTLLFCVGPMTLLGCLQDALEGKSDLLRLKSILDGVSAIFFAATLGAGVVLTALFVLLIQGVLTVLASKFKTLADDESMLAEMQAVGGTMLLGIGLNLIGVTKIPVANYLPALILCPIEVKLFRPAQ